MQNAGRFLLEIIQPQAAGDYASGPNHVLPTAGAARFRGGLSVMDFVKLITVQELSRSGLRRIAPAIQTLALTEELQAMQRRCGSEARLPVLKPRDAIRYLKEYHPPLSGRQGLRLDFNENTIGCSPRVLKRLQSLTGEELARYPEREPSER